MMLRQRDDEKHEEFKQQWIMAPNATKFQFDQPPLGIHPKEFVNMHFGPDSKAKNCQFLKGTTTLAFIYKPKTAQDRGGVVVAVDSRASSGEYISSKTVKKILHINDRMVATMAGGAADCQFWIRVVAKYCNLYELREKTPISVRATSKYFANVLYQYRGMGLSIGSMIAGIDASGPSIFLVDSEGNRLPQKKLCSVGSGSLSAYGILDTHYKEEMTDEEAVELGKKAIMHATHRDAGSGGFVTVAHISDEGKTVHGPFDVSDLYDQFAKKSGKKQYEPKLD